MENGVRLSSWHRVKQVLLEGGWSSRVRFDTNRSFGILGVLRMHPRSSKLKQEVFVMIAGSMQPYLVKRLL